MSLSGSAVSLYEEISQLNTAHGITLVRHVGTGKIYVKKVLSVYNPDVYTLLFEHPVRNTPRIYALQESDGLLTVIEEYISGESLDEIMDICGPIPETDTALCALKLCRILEDLHAFRPPVVHRDIKPSNLIRTEDGRIVLIDMNAAKLMNPKKDADTRHLGTPGYAAPEQYGFGSSSVSTDIYAVGALMDSLLSGGKGGGAKSAGKKLGNIIRKCLSLDPRGRYPSAAALAKDLLTVPGVAAADAATAETRRPRLFRFLITCIALALLCCVLSAALAKKLSASGKDVLSGAVYEPGPSLPGIPEFLPGSYEGSDGSGLTLYRDGTAVYYNESGVFSEPGDPWTYSGDRIEVQLHKLHCTISADVKDENQDVFLFTSDSRNWMDESFRKLPAENPSYYSNAMKSHDNSITVLPDGNMSVSAGGLSFTIPKHYLDYEDEYDRRTDVVIVADSDADNRHGGGLCFQFVKDDHSVDLDYFFDGLSKSFLYGFLYDVETADIRKTTVAGRETYTARFTGICNAGFVGAAGTKAEGLTAFMHKPGSQDILRIIMLRYASDDDNEDMGEFEGILLSAYEEV